MAPKTPRRQHQKFMLILIDFMQRPRAHSVFNDLAQAYFDQFQGQDWNDAWTSFNHNVANPAHCRDVPETLSRTASIHIDSSDDEPVESQARSTQSSATVRALSVSAFPEEDAHIWRARDDTVPIDHKSPLMPCSPGSPDNGSDTDINMAALFLQEAADDAQRPTLAPRDATEPTSTLDAINDLSMYNFPEDDDSSYHEDSDASSTTRTPTKRRRATSAAVSTSHVHDLSVFDFPDEDDESITLRPHITTPTLSATAVPTEEAPVDSQEHAIYDLSGYNIPEDDGGGSYHEDSDTPITPTRKRRDPQSSSAQRRKKAKLDKALALGDTPILSNVNLKDILDSALEGAARHPRCTPTQEAAVGDLLTHLFTTKKSLRDILSLAKPRAPISDTELEQHNLGILAYLKNDPNGSFSRIPKNDYHALVDQMMIATFFEAWTPTDRAFMRQIRQTVYDGPSKDEDEDIATVIMYVVYGRRLSAEEFRRANKHIEWLVKGAKRLQHLEDVFGHGVIIMLSSRPCRSLMQNFIFDVFTASLNNLIKAHPELRSIFAPLASQVNQLPAASWTFDTSKLSFARFLDCEQYSRGKSRSSQDVTLSQVLPPSRESQNQPNRAPVARMSTL